MLEIVQVLPCSPVKILICRDHLLLFYWNNVHSFRKTWVDNSQQQNKPIIPVFLESGYPKNISRGQFFKYSHVTLHFKEDLMLITKNE